jgi:N-acetylglutamate synthase-like GNAT family acetyltransferase
MLQYSGYGNQPINGYPFQEHPGLWRIQLKDKTVSVLEIRPIEVSDRNWVADLLDEHWGSTKVVSRGKIYYAHLLEGFAAEIEGEHVGLVTYRAEGEECEILTLNSQKPGIGVGAALLEAVKEVAASLECKRLWMITTNDNMNALRFYQKRGFSLVAVHVNALLESRKLKPQIPLTGLHGIPLRDEIELEIQL